MRRWILLGLTGCLGAAIVIAVAFTLSGGGDAHGPQPVAPSPRAVVTARPSTAAPVTVTAPAAPAPATTTTTRARAPAPAAPGRPLSAAEAEQAARLFLIGFAGDTPTAAVRARITAHDWGGVVLQHGNGGTPQQVAALIGQLRRWAVRAGHTAPLVAAVQPGGAVDAVPVGTPAAAAQSGVAAARRIAAATGRVLHALGVGLVLGPVADIATAGGPWEGRAFSDDPTVVTPMVSSSLAGFKAAGIAAAPGHFPGEGAASGDPADGQATVGESEGDLQRRDLQPFLQLALHAPALQLSSATYVAFDGVTPATLLPGVVDLLRGPLRFGGVVVSGDLAAASLATGDSVAATAVEALKAGCDLLWIPGDAADQDAAWRAVTQALRTGQIPPARLRDALARVAALRARYGAA
ncbi:hypothetical protein FSW04_07595 [Baekduia soli]|uniref:beta-N-acetylhexosaminidase n=1 Tax=Baekduia soli TaxID=496014 RepID=A0A5B8U352_9ACTN|nr:glycoside hydrolase family 3 N-terminal domain-containing protein [Baekduia soli]QEC47456.1 hypothetical protein FSW04_07595 [Baekduia soli]